MKTVLVSLPEGVYEIIEKELIGKLGESKSEVVRTLVATKLMELGYIGKEIRNEQEKQKKNRCL